MARRSKLFLDFQSALAHLRKDELSSSIISALSNPTRQNVAAFVQTWAQLPAELRRRAAQMMVELAEENIELDFNPLFRHLLNDGDARVRALGIEGLWEDEDPALVKPLVGFLRSDPDARVRAVAADALGRFALLAEYNRLPKSPHAEMICDALFAAIDSEREDLTVRCRAVEALGYSSRAGIREAIAAAYQDDAAEMRASAIAAMGHTADSYWGKTAAQELDSPDPRMRYYAARAMGELEFRAAVPRLIEMLDDSDREVQGVAIAALGQIGGKEAKAALQRVAASDDEAARELAEEALQELQFASDPNFLLFDLELEDEWREDAEE
jgi:HEAT repeat protein